MRVSDLTGPVLAGFKEFRMVCRSANADTIGDPGQALYGIVYPGHGELYNLAPYRVRKLFASLAQAASLNSENPEFSYPSEREPD